MIRKASPFGESCTSEPYRRVFISRVHSILAEGYCQLTPSEYESSQETTITGDLAEAMVAFLESPSAPGWTDHFDVHDDPPENDGSRKGRRRKRVDIKAVWTKRPRMRFRFEAKRLGPGHSTTGYLGKDGMGCFLTGAYGGNESDAGMLGYVQRGTVVAWAAKIEKQLRENDKYSVVDKANCWLEMTTAGDSSRTYFSEHNRGNRETIRLYHTFLSFN